MTASEVEVATEPARWLLEAGTNGIDLTQTHALSRAVVREAAERWPHWWHAELFGPPHREADLALLEALHAGLRRLRLLGRRGRKLFTTERGRKLARDPGTVFAVLAEDLGEGDPFTEAVAGAVTDALAAGSCSHDDLTAAVSARVGLGVWRDPHGRPPTESDISWVVADVLRRGEAYGLTERLPDPDRPRLLSRKAVLSEAGRLVLGARRRESPRMAVLVFDAELLNARGVRAALAVGADQPLSALHDAIQQAFGWYDDHLYSFWLDGVFWGDRELELTTPDAPDEAARTADAPLAELGLAVGDRLAYVFDFGDEWRVLLTLRESTEPDGGDYPRVLEREGNAPPQYPAAEER